MMKITKATSVQRDIVHSCKILKALLQSLISNRDLLTIFLMTGTKLLKSEIKSQTKSNYSSSVSFQIAKACFARVATLAITFGSILENARFNVRNAPRNLVKVVTLGVISSMFMKFKTITPVNQISR